MCLLLLGALVGNAQEPAPQVYTNGRWFDGTRFVERTVAVTADGTLEFREGGKNPAATDLAGGFVIPPFCEGHNHNIAVGKPEERNTKYMNAGVFYALIPNNAPQIAEAERSYWDQKDTIDPAFAHGGLTGKGGHPVEILEGIRKGGGYPPGTVLEDHAYFEIATTSELQSKWPKIAGFRPHFVKLFLEFSEEYDTRKDDPAFFGKRGLSPEVFRMAVELAHKDGLRAAAHVVSGKDFHLAVDAGVDLVAHLPGYQSVQEIAPEDAAAAAKKKIPVVTTASLPKAFVKQPASLEAVQSMQKRNLKLLKDAGVQLAIGSDSWGDTSHGEVAYLRALGVFTDLELLHMWTQNCAHMIFPDRKIGQLQPGYEADFLVLDGNPLQDFTATRRIKMKVKAGRKAE